MFRIAFATLAAVVALSLSSAYFGQPAQPVDSSDKIPSSFQVSQLQSLWYWANSNVMAQEFKRGNPIRYSLYRDLQTDYEKQLATLGVCVRVGKQRETLWFKCGDAR